jgi:CMD domain protein
MTTPSSDIIDLLAGIAPGSPLDALRRAKPITRDNAEASYRALFAPVAVGGVSLTDRYAVAAFVTGLHGTGGVADFYASQLAGEPDGGPLAAAIAAEIKLGITTGPYGHYPAGPLTSEDVPGPTFRVSANGVATLGARLAAGLDHAHMLVFHPRDASPAALQALLDAGWTTSDIVTLSQLVAFLSFQIRVVTGLRALAA